MQHWAASYLGIRLFRRRWRNFWHTVGLGTPPLLCDTEHRSNSGTSKCSLHRNNLHHNRRELETRGKGEDCEKIVSR